jgi:hypothetical protein
MQDYYITFTHNGLPPEHNTSCAIKWAHDPKSAVRLLLSRNPDKDGTVHYKRGGSGKILSVEEVTTKNTNTKK